MNVYISALSAQNTTGSAGERVFLSTRIGASPLAARVPVDPPQVHRLGDRAGEEGVGRERTSAQ